jgi:branched-chain amino acid transport system permease protein
MPLGKAVVVTWVAGFILAVVLGLTLPVYWVYVMTAVIIGTLIARSVGFVTIQAGLISLCQMSFAAIGGWIVSWLALALPGVAFPLLVIIGGLVALPVGWLLGFLTARIRGVELAVVTLGCAAGLDLVLRQGSFPGVSTGTPVIPAAPLDDPRWFFLFALILILILQTGVLLLNRTTLAVGWTTLRASERSAAAMGLRVPTMKANAFAMGALFAGLAGGLLAAQYGLLTTAAFSPVTSMGYLATAVLCGAGFLGGALLAGVVSVLVPEILGRLGLPLDLGPALLALGAFDVLRRGKGGLAEQFAQRLQDRRFRATVRTCEPTAETPGSTKSPTSDVAILDVRNLTVTFGQLRALDSVDLTVREGEVHALLGPNGAGKSVLIDAASGFLPSYEGAVSLEGISLDGLRAFARSRRGMRRTFQQSPALDALAVDDFLRVSSGSGSGSGSGRREHINRVRDFFGLPDGGIPVRLLDYGSRRILEIAAALASQPRVVLLDEPASGLPERESRALAACISRIPAAFDCSVLLVEHDIGFVRQAASRATALREGQIISSGAVSEVLADPEVISSFTGRISTT